MSADHEQAERVAEWLRGFAPRASAFEDLADFVLALAARLEDALEISSGRQDSVRFLHRQLEEAQLEHDETLDTLQDIRQEVERAQREKAELADAIIWMSGSPSFSEDGEAHEGWVKIRDGVLAQALAASSTPRDSDAS